jgi:hypothetical protein
MDADCQIKMLVAKSKTETIIEKLNKIKMKTENL